MVRGGREVYRTDWNISPINQHPLLLKPPRAFPEILVSHAEKDDGRETEEEGGEVGDLPPAKDDADVSVVPGEDHLHMLRRR